MSVSSSKKVKEMSTPEVVQTVEDTQTAPPAPTLTFAQIQEQIKILTEQAELIRKAEIANVISEIKVKINQYKITAQELGFTTSPIKAVQTTKVTNTVAPKYQNSDGSMTWTGRGKHPKWVNDHLSAGGSLDDLLINPQ
jgi:DNA-binding protein H-NS